MQRNPNKNCLQGLRCPRCRQTDSFEIVAVSTFTVVDEGTDEFAGVEWSDESPAACTQCDFAGTVAQLKDPEAMLCRECGGNVFVDDDGTSHHWNDSDEAPLSDVDHELDADHVAIVDQDESTDPEPDPAPHEDVCILTGADYEDPDDCTTHAHESDVIEVMPAQLRGGETLVGDAGGTLSISGEVYLSSSMQGLYAVENEFGTLYLDADLPVRILSDD